MKRNIVVIFSFILILLCGCGKIKEDDLKLEMKNEKPLEVESINHSEEKIEDFVAWIKDTDTFVENEGAFKKLVELYYEIGYLLVPSLENDVICNVFSDSNVNFINYVFKNSGIRVVIEPLNEDEVVKYTNEGIEGVVRDKFDLDNIGKSFNYDDSDINGETIETMNGYQNVKFVDRVMKIDGIDKTCILEKKYNNETDVENILMFIDENMLIRVIGFGDESEFEELLQGRLLLEKMMLN